MGELNLDKSYWDERYRTQETGWDIGEPSTPFVEYFNQVDNKQLKILIPGAGNSYEAEFLLKAGFLNVFVLDVSEEPLKNLVERIPGFPKSHIICDDFFEHTGSYDVVLEQTFFCAIDPSLRQKYADKVWNLLPPGGKLVGVLFDDKLNTDHPPFGGSKEEYLKYFEKFDKLHFEKCHNSIKPRQGREIFALLKKGKVR